MDEYNLKEEKKMKNDFWTKIYPEHVKNNRGCFTLPIEHLDTGGLNVETGAYRINNCKTYLFSYEYCLNVVNTIKELNPEYIKYRFPGIDKEEHGKITLRDYFRQIFYHEGEIFISHSSIMAGYFVTLIPIVI